MVFIPAEFNFPETHIAEFGNAEITKRRISFCRILHKATEKNYMWQNSKWSKRLTV